MKKIISLILSLSMLTAGLVYADSYSDVETYDEAIDVITGLGIMNETANDTFSPDAGMKRGDLARIIADIYNSGDNSIMKWKQIYFRTLEEERSIKEPPEEIITRYSDVDNTNDYYDDVTTVSERGIMIGVENDKFDVEGYATISQIAAVLVRMTGHELIIDKKTESEYFARANELKLLKNVNKSASDVATRADTARMIYNCFDVALMQITIEDGRIVYVEHENETFLNKIIGVEKLTDRMTDNGISTLSSESEVGRNNCVIGGYTFEIPEELDYIRDYIGRETYTYYENNDGDYELRYVCLSERDTIVTFDISDLEEYSVSRLTYSSEDNSNTKSVLVEVNSGMIYNGMGANYYDKSTFDFYKGTVTVVIPKGASKGDLIIVKKYNDFVIDYIDSEKSIIYSTSTLVNDEKMLDLEDTQERVIKIYDNDGNLTDFSALTTGMITSVCESESMVEIYISTNTAANFVVKSIIYDDEIVYLKGEEGTYKLSSEFVENYKDMIPVTGKKYDFGLDIFNEIVTATAINTSDDTAVMIKAIIPEDIEEESIIITYITAESSVYKKKLAKRVKVLNRDDSMVTWKFPKSYYAAEEALKDYHGLFMFKLNEDDEISEIEFPGVQKDWDNEEGRLVEIPMNKNQDYYPGKGFYYKINVGFSGQLLINSSTTKVFCVDPANLKSESGYSVTTPSVFRNDTKYEIKGYTTVKDSQLAQYMIWESPYKVEMNLGDNLYAVVLDIYKGIDSDDLPAQIMKLALNTDSFKTTEYIVTEDAINNVTTVQGDSTFTNEKGEIQKLEVEKGDIIKYAFDDENRVSEIKLIFDENAINPVSGRRGMFPNCIGYWDAENPSYSNPYAYDEKSFKFTPLANMWSTNGGGCIRYMRVSPIKYTDNGLRTTTQDLNVFEYDSTDSRYITEIQNSTRGCFITRDRRGNISIAQKSLAGNIKTYDIVGNNCDRVVLAMRIGAVRSLFVYSGEWE